MFNPHLAAAQKTAASAILETWEEVGRDAADTWIEELCQFWNGNKPLVSNLLRSATERGFQIAIECETGNVSIIEPEGDKTGSFPMYKLLIEHFDAIQLDAYEHVIHGIQVLHEDFAEAA